MTDTVGFGTNGVSDKETLKTAIEEGYRLFDSADLYKNADKLSAVITESGIAREKFFINYKIFPDLGKVEFLNHVHTAVEKFGYVDCLMLHDIAVNRRDLKEILEALRPLLASGQIRRLGVSNISHSSLESLLKDFSEITLVQNQFCHLQQDQEVRALCKEKGIEYMGYGLFGGNVKGGDCRYYFDPTKAAWNLSALIFPDLHALATKYQTTPHGMLLAWSILQDTIQIPSSSKREHLRSNLAASKIALQITQEDQAKLTVALAQFVPTQQWTEILDRATQGDRLALMKEYVGNSLPRHRLLEMAYRETELKPFYDLLLDKQAEDPEDATYQQMMNRRHVNILTHFLEESLNAGELVFHTVVDHLKTICLNTSTDQDFHAVFELMTVLAEQTHFDFRANQLEKFVAEQQFLQTHGYFEVEEFEPDPNDNSYFAMGITIGLVGPDHKLYVARNLSANITLDELSQLLRAKFPADFKDPIKSFYIPDLNKVASGRATLNNLSICFGEVIDIGDERIAGNFKRFFHNVSANPQAFAEAKLPTLAKTM